MCVLRLLNPLFYTAVGTFMHFDGSGVNTDILCICIQIQFSEYLFKDSVFLPLAESSIYALPASIAFRQLAPLTSGSQYPQHAIQHHAVIFSRSSFLTASLRWQIVFDSVPLACCYFISFCHASIILFFVICAIFIFQTRPNQSIGISCFFQ